MHMPASPSPHLSAKVNVPTAHGPLPHTSYAVLTFRHGHFVEAKWVAHDRMWPSHTARAQATVDRFVVW